jgi:CRP/FNR family cyclic AMP-dependent transcriptional regulator
VFGTIPVQQGYRARYNRRLRWQGTRLEAIAKVKSDSIQIHVSKDFVLLQEGVPLMAAMKTVKVAPTLAGDPYVAILLGNISEGKRLTSIARDETIFSQGDRADGVYFIQTGRVKVSVVSSTGKEAVLAMLGPHDCFGGESLVGKPLRLNTATTLESATLYQVEKRAMLRALRSQPDLSAKFIGCLLKRNNDLEEDLADQLFNHSEKRLARVLLKLARLPEHQIVLDVPMPALSHEILAEMVGTTRSRITHFMNKFRKMGLIEYNGHARGTDLTVRTERLTDAVLHDAAITSPTLAHQ